METKQHYHIVDYLIDEFLTLVVTNNLDHTKRRDGDKEFTTVTVHGTLNQLTDLDTQWNTIKSKYDPEYFPKTHIHAKHEDKRQPAPIQN